MSDETEAGCAHLHVSAKDEPEEGGRISRRWSCDDCDSEFTPSYVFVNPGREFLEAVEALLDWMNNIDLSADHADQKPEDYERICEALEKWQTLIRGRDEEVGKA